MSVPTITIDGHVLNDRFTISNIERPFPTFSVASETLDGRDGALIKARQLDPRPVSFRLWAFSHDHGEMLAEFSWLVELCAGDGEHTLVFSDEDGYARRVVLECDPSYDEYEERGSVPLTFTMYDPYREQIDPNTFTVRYGTPATFVVGHDRPRINITTTQAQRDSTTHLWGIRFDNGDMLRVKLPTALQTPVDIDVRHRRVLVGHEVTMLTLESDWPALKAGTHTAIIDVGSGSAAITIRERCL